MRVCIQLASFVLIFVSLQISAEIKKSEAPFTAKSSVLTKTGKRLPLQRGPRQTLALPIQFEDNALTCSTDDLRATLFTSSTSAAALYAEASYGVTTLEGEVLNPLTVPYAESGNCEWELWSQMALDAATASGIDVSSYQHRVFILPAGVCNPTAFSEVGGTNVYNIGFCDNVFMYAHEIGHNMGFNHASTPTEVAGDFSSLMGETNAAVHFNSVEKEKVGWIPPEKVSEITVTGTYQIATSQRISGPDALLVKVNDATDGMYFVSFRTPDGFDANLSELWKNRVYIHQWVNETSVLHAILGDGETFTSPSGQTAIQMLSHNAETATIAVRMGNVLEEPLAPSINLFPAYQSGLAGTTLSYELQVTNNDPASLGSTTFDVSAMLPEGLTAEFPLNLTLAAGTSVTLPILVTSHAATAANTLDFSITLNNPAVPVHNASATATYSVEVLQPLPPIVTFTPNSQSGKPGDTLTYVLTLSNQDPTGLPPSTFHVAFQGAGLEASFEADYTLETGANAVVEIKVTSPLEATAGPRPFVVSISDKNEPAHSLFIDGLYTVEAVSNPDVSPPTNPTKLTAIGVCGPASVKLNWTGSKDNVGVVGYNVWRNGAKLSTSTGPAFQDSKVSVKNTYAYKVQAFDAAGNLSGFSNEVKVKFVRNANNAC